MPIVNTRSVTLTTKGGGTTSPRTSLVHVVFPGGGQLTITASEVNLSRITGAIALADDTNTGVGRMICATSAVTAAGSDSIDLELVSDASSLGSGDGYLLFFGT